MGGTKRGRSKSPKPSPKLTAKKAATEDPDDAELKARYAAQLAKTKLMFMENRAQKMSVDVASATLKKETKRLSDYGAVLNQNAQIVSGQGKGASAAATAMLTAGESAQQLMLTGPGEAGAVPTGLEDKGIAAELRQEAIARVSKAMADPESEEANTPLEKKEYALVPVGQKPNTLSLKTKKKIEPEWHAPWKMMRVISGHQGWVRAVEVEPGNEWFATGASDSCIKIWDMASGALKLTLTGHISCIRGIQVSRRSPYMFTVSEDKTVKCWDLEYNKVVRHYHGHLSGVFSCALHPELDVLCTGGRDCAVRLWDIRTEAQIHCMTGHNDAVCDIKCQSAEPQIISGSMDNTIKLWDIVGGRARTTLTNHKKSIRGLAVHPRDYTFCSAGADNIKQWKCPDGKFIQNLSGHNAIINTICVNHENVLFSGGDNGSMKFWDWRTGYCFQDMETVAQPGSLESEAGIFTSCFDQTGSRLITCEADKTVKIWKEDEEATPETHPIEFKEIGNKKKW